MGIFLMMEHTDNIFRTRLRQTGGKHLSKSVVKLGMRMRVYTYVLLSVWAIVVAKPLLAYVQYSLFKSYIAQNLCVKKNEANNCCKGKCYLATQLAQSHDLPTKGNERTPKKGDQNDLKEFVVAKQNYPICFFENHPPVPTSTMTFTKVINHPVFVPPKG